MSSEVAPEVVLIAGMPLHGKTLVAGLVEKLLHTPHANTSDLIYEKLADECGMSVKDLRSLDKAAIRADLVRVGDGMCRKDPAAILTTLVRERGFRIIAGVRKKAEVEAFRKHSKCVVLWVHRPGGEVVQDNTDLSADDADYTIVNEGGLQPILAQLRRVLTPALSQALAS